MNGLINENQLAIFTEYKFNKPLIPKIVYVNDESYRDCHNEKFHTFEDKCVYNNRLKNIGNNETNILPFSDKAWVCMK